MVPSPVGATTMPDASRQEKRRAEDAAPSAKPGQVTGAGAAL